MDTIFGIGNGVGGWEAFEVSVWHETRRQRQLLTLRIQAVRGVGMDVAANMRNCPQDFSLLLLWSNSIQWLVKE